MRLAPALAAISLALSLCTGEEPQVTASDTIRFRTVAGLRFIHTNGSTAEKHMIETMGSGAAFLDFDVDGWLDLYLVQGAGGRGKLYRNHKGQRFTDVTGGSGIDTPGIHGMGVAVADYDNDGLPDLYITGYPRNYLFRNLGAGKFQDVTTQAGVTAGGWSTSAIFFDYDRDGLLDLYVGRYVDYIPKEEPYCGLRKPGWRSYCLPDVFEGIAGILYRNNGSAFEDVTHATGLSENSAKTLGVAAGDYNRDGWPDLFVANDRVRNFLFRNNGKGHFAERGEIDGTAYSNDGTARAGMGTDFGDFNNDTWPDLLVTNFETEGAGLFQSLRGESFEDIAMRSDLGRKTYMSVGFGAKFADFDNDGFLDIFVANGHVIDNIALYKDSVPYRQRKQVFRNIAGRAFQLSGSALGASPASVGRGAAFGDFNNDGYVDVLVTNNGGEAELLENVSDQENKWIAFQLVGTRSNRDAIGARIELWTAGQHRVREVSRGGSYLSAHDPRVIFGLRRESSAVRVMIHWPSGVIQELKNLQSGRIHVIQEEDLP